MTGHIDYSIGDLKWSIQEHDHDYYLKCDGRSLERTRYPALFELIGTTYGSLNGESFNLPDCRGRVVGCIGAGPTLTPRSAGTKVGKETHTLTISEMPSHNHGVTDNGHSHSYVNQPNSHEVFGGVTNTTADNGNVTQTTGTSYTGISIQDTGNNQPHNNMQPTIFIGNVFVAYRTQFKY